MVRHAPHRGTTGSSRYASNEDEFNPPLTPQSNDSSTFDSDPYQRLLKSSFTNDDTNLEMRLHPKERMSVDEVLRQLKEFRENTHENGSISSLDEEMRNDVEDVRTAATPATKEAKARQLEMIKNSGILHDLKQDEYNGLDELISPNSVTTEPKEAGNNNTQTRRSMLSNFKQKSKEIADYGNGDWSGNVKDSTYVQGDYNETVLPPVKKKTNIFQRWGKGLVDYERNMASKDVEQNEKINTSNLLIGRVSDENTATADTNVRKNKLTSIFGQSSHRLGVKRLGKGSNPDQYVKVEDTSDSNIGLTTTGQFTSNECKKKVTYKSKGKSRLKCNENMNSIPYSSLKGFNSFHHEANAALAAAGVAVSNKKDVGIQKVETFKKEIIKSSPKLYIVEQGSSESIFEFHEKEDEDDDSNIGLVNGISEDTTHNPINNDESYQDFIPKTTSMRSRHWPRPAATIPITISGRFHKEADAALSAALAAEEMKRNKEALVVAADSRPHEIVGVESVNESSIDHDDDDDDYDDEDEFFGNRDMSAELRNDCEADVTVEEEIFTAGSEDTLIQDMYTEPSVRMPSLAPPATDTAPSPPPAQPPKLDPVQLIMPYLQQMYQYPPPPAYQYPPPPPTVYQHTSGWTATYHYPPPMQYQYNNYGSYDPTPQTGAYYTINIPGA